jgi:hypothetical protein
VAAGRTGAQTEGDGATVVVAAYAGMVTRVIGNAFGAGPWNP